MYAHLYKIRSGYEVLITEGIVPTNPVQRIVVRGKRQARAAAEEANAKPWNF